MATSVAFVPSSFTIFAAIDDGNGAGAVRQHRQHLFLVNLFRVRHADRDLHLHRIGIKAERGGDVEGVVPKGVAQRADGGLRRIDPPYVGAHADFQHHAF